MALDAEALKVLSELKRKRGVVKAALTRTLKFIGNFDARVEALSLLEFRQEELPQINKKFDDVQVEIELLNTELSFQIRLFPFPLLKAHQKYNCTKIIK